MIRVAKRWNDYSFIADFVGQKYESDQAKQAEVKAKIIEWCLFRILGTCKVSLSSH